MKNNYEKLNVPLSQVEHLIDEWIFSERDRVLMKRVVLDGISFERAAAEFDLSVTRVKTIIYKGENIVLKHLK